MHGVGVAHRHRQDAGIGDDDVDPAEIGQSGLDGVAQFVAFTHVGIRATTRRPSSFTDRSVSERSSGVANGWGLLGMSRQISRATMSAPALAMATACARPWRRAAPVMTATCRRDVRTKDFPPLRLLLNVIRLACRPVHQPRAGSGDSASGCGPLTKPYWSEMSEPEVVPTRRSRRVHERRT